MLQDIRYFIEDLRWGDIFTILFMGVAEIGMVAFLVYSFWRLV